MQIPYLISIGPHKSKVTLQFLPHSKVLEIKVPSGTTSQQITLILEKKAKWISKQYQQVSEWVDRQSQFKLLFKENKIPFLGEICNFSFQHAKHRKVVHRGGLLTLYIKPSDNKYEEYVLVKNLLWGKAKEMLTERTYHLGEMTHSDIAAVKVKNQTGIWGSCSGKKNINLNWHLIFLPQALVDYVIIHELMHLREMNHSPKFWAQVESFYPDYRKADAALKSYQWLIGIFDHFSD